MANPTDPRPGHFRADLDDGQVVETDGSTIMDPESGAAVPATVPAAVVSSAAGV